MQMDFKALEELLLQNVALAGTPCLFCFEGKVPFQEVLLQIMNQMDQEATEGPSSTKSFVNISNHASYNPLLYLPEGLQPKEPVNSSALDTIRLHPHLYLSQETAESPQTEKTPLNFTTQKVLSAKQEISVFKERQKPLEEQVQDSPLKTTFHLPSDRPQAVSVEKTEGIQKLFVSQHFDTKRVRIQLEEGQVRFVLSGDKLKLYINLKEQVYEPPTSFEVHRLVQSLQSLGITTEVIKFNGSNLYSAEYRHGRKEDRERNQSSSDFSKESAESFSLYL